MFLVSLKLQMYPILLFGVKEKSCDIKIIPFSNDM